MRASASVLAAVLLLDSALAQTPRLNIRTKHGNPLEERRREQIERLAAQYDLKKYTMTRDIMVEQGAVNPLTGVIPSEARDLL